LGETRVKNKTDREFSTRVLMTGCRTGLVREKETGMETKKLVSASTDVAEAGSRMGASQSKSKLNRSIVCGRATELPCDGT
jgi:hypothetical protein